MDETQELTPALERVTASLAATQRKRLEVEAELQAAQAAIASVKTQSSSLEQSLHELQDQLSATLRVKAQEDVALSELAASKEKAIQELAGLRRSIQSALDEKESTIRAIDSAGIDMRNQLAQLQEDVTRAAADAKSAVGDVERVHNQLMMLRKTADAVDEELGRIETKGKKIAEVVGEFESHVQAASTGLETIAARRAEADKAAGRLKVLGDQIETQRMQAQASSDALAELLQRRQQQSQTLEKQLAAISQLIQADATPAVPETERTKASVPNAQATQAQAQSSPAGVTQPTPVQATAQPVAAPPPQPAPNVSAPAQAAAPVRETPEAAVAHPAPNGSVAAKAAASTASPPSKNGRPFPQTSDLIQLLAAEQLISADEATRANEVLNTGEVDKIVRSLWSRAMGGPAPAAHRLLIAEALSEAGDVKAATTFFNQVLSTKNLDPLMAYLVAVYLFDLDKPEEALKIGKLLARAKMGKVLSRNIDALYLRDGGKYEEAQQRLSEALGTPGFPRSHYHETLFNIARLHEEKGELGQALSWYEKLSATNPGYRDIENHIRRTRPVASAAS